MKWQEGERQDQPPHFGDLVISSMGPWANVQVARHEAILMAGEEVKEKGRTVLSRDPSDWLSSHALKLGLLS